MRPVDPVGVLDRRTVRADGATGSGGTRAGGEVERAPSPPAHPRPQLAMIDELSLRRRALLAEVTRLAGGSAPRSVRPARSTYRPCPASPRRGRRWWPGRTCWRSCWRHPPGLTPEGTDAHRRGAAHSQPGAVRPWRPGARWLAPLARADRTWRRTSSQGAPRLLAGTLTASARSSRSAVRARKARRPSTRKTTWSPSPKPSACVPPWVG